MAYVWWPSRVFSVFFCLKGEHNAKKLAFRIINPTASQPIFMILAIQCFTVCQIVPLITLFATLVHNGLTADWFCQWIQLAVTCFPMALCLQAFFIGPFVRLVFRNLFRKQLANI